jgi:hypothetical protein
LADSQATRRHHGSTRNLPRHTHQHNTEGKRHLGAAQGSNDFKTNYIKEKVATWCTEVNNLAEIAKSQPHAAYSAYILGQQHKYMYFLWTLNNIEEELKPLDEAINNVLIPAITGFHLNL